MNSVRKDQGLLYGTVRQFMSMMRRFLSEINVVQGIEPTSVYITCIEPVGNVIFQHFTLILDKQFRSIRFGAIYDATDKQRDVQTDKPLFLVQLIYLYEASGGIFTRLQDAVSPISQPSKLYQREKHGSKRVNPTPAMDFLRY